MKIKKVMAIVLTMSLGMSTLAGCGSEVNVDEVINSIAEEVAEEAEQVAEEIDEDVSEEKETEISFDMSKRPGFITELGIENEDPEYVANVQPYSVDDDFGNIYNASRIYLQEAQFEMLKKNKFLVTPGGGSEFFDVYEFNRYGQDPNFVTVDSMMHTYHLYYAMLQKHTEKNYLSNLLKEMTQGLYEETLAQYEVLKGSEWDSAVKRNLAFFTIGSALLIDETVVIDDIEECVNDELGKIFLGDGIEKSLITDDFEDYTQYKPRGYYDGDPELEAYFRAMMWYGRINFSQKSEELDRSALLLSLALNEAELENWEKIYKVTSFFAGASDDNGYYEYMPIIKDIFGENVEVNDLLTTTDGFEKFHKLTAELDPPRINSIPMYDDNRETNKTDVAKGFRLMGQRFTLDEAIFTNLTYSKVEAKNIDDKRFLPDALDLPAALGSDTALDILDEAGETEYPGYMENMEKLREEIKESEDTLYNASLYGNWLYTLKPMLEKRGEGFPSFMLSDEWNRRSIEGFLGSFTELKHDSVLYAKQMMAEMGGGWEEDIDDRGYVEPQPEVFSRLSSLTQATAKGLEQFDLISKEDKGNLKLLAEMADTLKVISIKELENESLTEDEHEFIRSYGGSIEHFWKETVKEDADSEYISSQEYPSAVVVDIATDPNGYILEEATGNVDTIYVIVPVEGKLKIAKGAVFSYYQFLRPLSEGRLTDREWRVELGIELNDDMEFAPNEELCQPEWVYSYRKNYVYEY